MKKRLTAVALMLSLIMAAVSTALPAQAATAGKPSLSMFATGDDAADGTRYFYITASGLKGRKVTLQVSTGSAWKDVKSRTVSDPVSEQFSAEHRRLTAGSYKYRAVAMDGTTVSAASNTVASPYTPPAPDPSMDISVRGNVVDIKVTNGRGLLVKLYRTDQGRKLLWSAAAPETKDSYTLSVPVTVTSGAAVGVQAFGYKGSVQKAESGSLWFWAYAPVKLGFYVDSQDYDAKKVFTLTGDIAEGAVVSVQRLYGSTWGTVWTSKPFAQGQANPVPVYTFPAEASASFRVVQKAGGKTTYTSSSKVSFAKLSSELRSASWGEMFQDAEGRIGSNTSVSHTYFLDHALSDRKGYFQEHRNGKWVTLKTLTFRKSSGYPNAKGVTVKTPLTTATVTRKYRVMLPATAREKAWTSKSAVIKHMNPRHYTGYKKTVYNYMKKYCPNQVITLREGRTSYAYSPSYRIEMAQGMSGKTLQYVALHECAHIREFKLYDNNYNALNKRMNAIFGGTGSLGMERAADCMSYAMGADRNYGGSYQRNCSANQMTAARKMLAGTRP